MGVVRRPGTRRLYFRFHDGTGWKSKPSPYFIGEEAAAERAFTAARKKVGAAAALEQAASGRTTVEGYLSHFEKERRDAKKAGARNEVQHIRDHIIPRWGAKSLDGISRADVKTLISHLKQKPRAPKTRKEKLGEVKVVETLSPRTIAGIMTSARSFFGMAVDEELIAANPIQIKRGMLPPKRDRKINRRDAMVRAEVEQIISDTRLPLDRRAMYALDFLGGPRPGEIAALRWRHLEARKPLAAMRVEGAFSTELDEEKGTKTEVPREFPVHPTAAALLAEWRLAWPDFMGRHPKLDDLIFPAPPAINAADPRKAGGHRSRGGMNHRFKQDCARIGVRPRYQYMKRHTFVSLARAAGIHKDDLRWISHGVAVDVIDGYTTPEWERLCSLVCQVKIERLKGEVVAMPKAANSGSAAPQLVQVLVQADGGKEKTPESSGLSGVGAGWALQVSKVQRSPDRGHTSPPPPRAKSGAYAPAPSTLKAGSGPVLAFDLHDLHERCAACSDLHRALEAATHDEDARARTSALRELRRHLGGGGR